MPELANVESAGCRHSFFHWFQMALHSVPYLSATQSGIVQIAYGFDKPVVVTNVGGLPEVVEDGKTGYVVPSRDAASLAQAVKDFFKGKRAGDFQTNIEKENTKYSWDVMARRVQELLEREE